MITYEILYELLDYNPNDGIFNWKVKNSNRIGNLRQATHSQNMMNRGKQKNNTSGYKGVFYNKRAKKWQVSIYQNGKHIYLGVFNSLEEASLTYQIAADKYHGEFANFN